MSCKECDEIQDKAFNKNIPESVPIAYIRIENSNMALVGCHRHLKIATDAIRERSKQ